MLALDRPLVVPKLSRFAWLMGLYSENFQRMQRLLRPETLARGTHESVGHDGLALRIDVLELHPYTVEMRLSYRIKDPLTGQPDPSAYVRHYHDARQSEVTHCYVGQRWQDVLGLRPSVHEMLGHRLRMNSFFSKWLEYLALQGHQPDRIQPSPEAADTHQCKSAVDDTQSVF
jgi:uncharacterized protein YqiB (DUF1249 family)